MSTITTKKVTTTTKPAVLPHKTVNDSNHFFFCKISQQFQKFSNTEWHSNSGAKAKDCDCIKASSSNLQW